MPLFLSLQLPEQANTHKNKICLPDEKMNLKQVHILENIWITNYLSHPPANN